MPSIVEASEDLRFAAALAAFAQQLKGGQYPGGFDTALLRRYRLGDAEAFVLLYQRHRFGL